MDRLSTNISVAWFLVIIAISMFCFGFLIAPYFDTLCELAGIGGKIKSATIESSISVDRSREITVEFETSVNGSVGLAFWVETQKLKVHPGEFYTVNFYAKNTSNESIRARAIPSVLPSWLTKYFKKSECFCFSEHTFEPNIVNKLTVRFQIDQAIDRKVVEMTLGYTFFDITRK